MTPVHTVDTTCVLGAPKNWDHDGPNGPCSGLPIVWAGDRFHSFWRPTWRDRVRILFGQPIRLVVASSAHPPVAIDTETVFE